MMRPLMGRLMLLIGVPLLAGCFPTFAPPIRGLHAGMPGRLGAGQLEAGISAGGLAVPEVGGPHLAFGLRDWLGVEAGANYNLAAGWNWLTGWGGVRLTRQGPTRSTVRLIGDLELGAGAGVGGRVYDSCANFNDRSGRTIPTCHAMEWTRVPAYGIYEGFGLGLQWTWLGVFVRGRLDASASGVAPTTLWPTAMLGVEVRPRRWFSFGVGGGYAGYWNQPDRLVSLWFFQAQLAATFDVAGTD